MVWRRHLKRPPATGHRIARPNAALPWLGEGPPVVQGRPRAGLPPLRPPCEPEWPGPGPQPRTAAWLSQTGRGPGRRAARAAGVPPSGSVREARHPAAGAGEAAARAAPRGRLRPSCRALRTGARLAGPRLGAGAGAARGDSARRALRAGPSGRLPAAPGAARGGGLRRRRPRPARDAPPHTARRLAAAYRRAAPCAAQSVSESVCRPRRERALPARARGLDAGARGRGPRDEGREEHPATQPAVAAPRAGPGK